MTTSSLPRQHGPVNAQAHQTFALFVGHDDAGILPEIFIPRADDAAIVAAPCVGHKSSYMTRKKSPKHEPGGRQERGWSRPPCGYLRHALQQRQPHQRESIKAHARAVRPATARHVVEPLLEAFPVGDGHERLPARQIFRTVGEVGK